MKTLINLLFLVLIALFASEAHAAATCYCKISRHNLKYQTNATGVILDLTSAVNKTYTGPGQQGEANQQSCQGLCDDAALPYVNSQSLANTACAALTPDRSELNAYSAVGNRQYRLATAIGVLNNRPEVSYTTCTCPAGWAANPTNVLGGVTTDGRCKKMAAQPITITPFPANGTQLGTWGFAWGNALYAWGTNSNGGGATCVTHVSSEAYCKFGA